MRAYARSISSTTGAGADCLTRSTDHPLAEVYVLAGRPQDVQDAEAVLGAQDGLDTDRVMHVLCLIEQALDRADLVPVFRRLLAARRQD